MNPEVDARAKLTYDDSCSSPTMGSGTRSSTECTT